MYIRFETDLKFKGSSFKKGIFAAMGDARRKGSMSLAEHIWYINTANWFHDNLDYPLCFDQPVLSNIRFKAQSWFKYKSSLHLEKSVSVAKLLQKHGIGVSVKLTADPGVIIYEDALQVVVLPSLSI